MASTIDVVPNSTVNPSTNVTTTTSKLTPSPDTSSPPAVPNTDSMTNSGLIGGDVLKVDAQEKKKQEDEFKIHTPQGKWYELMYKSMIGFMVLVVFGIITFAVYEAGIIIPFFKTLYYVIRHIWLLFISFWVLKFIVYMFVMAFSMMKWIVKKAWKNIEHPNGTPVYNRVYKSFWSKPALMGLSRAITSFLYFLYLILQILGVMCLIVLIIFFSHIFLYSVFMWIGSGGNDYKPRPPSQLSSLFASLPSASLPKLPMFKK
jgi:hypothetical protein